MRTDITEIKKDIEKFSDKLKEMNYQLYAITLTYKDKEFVQETNSFKYYKIPKHKIALSKNFKYFKDKMVRAYKKRGIYLEFYFIYANHKSKRSNDSRTHLHGIIGVSRGKRLNDDIRKFWKHGYIRIKKIDDLQGWIDYLEFNMKQSKSNYSEKNQIYSKTRLIKKRIN